MAKHIFSRRFLSRKWVQNKQQSEVLKEVKLMQGFKHPHIIKYYHSFIDGNYFFILMEYASGGDLYKVMEKAIDSKTKFQEKQLWKWAYEILLAVEYLHNNYVIHWDLKPSNIFLSKSKRIKIGDFGCSRVLNPAKMYLTENVGTTVYLSPEQVNHVTVYDNKIDIWAVGWCLYHLWAYKPPFTGSTFSNLAFCILNDDPAELSKDYSEEFKAFIMKMLTKIPKERPSSIELCLLIPATVINNYTLPKQSQPASTSFMNPTKSAVERQKSKSKRTIAEDTYKSIRMKKFKNKLGKIVEREQSSKNMSDSKRFYYLLLNLFWFM